MLQGIGHRLLGDAVEVAGGGRIREGLDLGTHELAFHTGERQRALGQLEEGMQQSA